MADVNFPASPSNNDTYSEGGRTWRYNSTLNAWLVVGEAEEILTTVDLLDEDDMASDSASKVPSQQSVKAYVDATAAPVDSVNSLTGAVVLDPDDLDDSLSTNKFASTTNVSAAGALMKVAGGASVENIGAIESNVQTVAASGATETLDTATYGVFDVTMDEDCTFTFSNPAPSGKMTSFVLVLRGAFTPTLPGSVDWGDASAPTYTTPSMYVFTTLDAGTTWLGVQAGKAFA